VPSEPSRDVDALYAVPLAAFTRRRNELAVRLGQSGRREEAAAVRRLRRPSVPVWAINTLARHEPTAVRAFADATDRLKRAQLRDRHALGEAAQAQRRALQNLMRSAEGILRAGGYSPTAQTAQRISGTLLGAATDRETRQALLRGRLTEERQAPGFEALEGAPSGRVTERRQPGIRAAEHRRSRARAAEERRAQQALEVRRQARTHADDLARKASALEEEAGARAREGAEAERAVEELRRQLGEAEARARERRAAARTAAVAAQRARRAATRLAAKLRP